MWDVIDSMLQAHRDARIHRSRTVLTGVGAPIEEASRSHPGSSVSPLPPGWVVASVAQAGSARAGAARSPDRNAGADPTPYVRAANITDHGIDVEDIAVMDFTADEQDDLRLLDGDVLLTEASGSAKLLGRSAIWRDELPLCCFQNHVLRFRGHAVRPEFAHAAFRHALHQGEFERIARGIGIQHLGLRRFSEMEIPIAPWDEQGRIVDALESRLDELTEGRAALSSALARLDELDREVLAAVATGSLGVPTDETERLAPESGLAGRNPIPSGWHWRRVDEVGEVVLGKTLGSQASGATKPVAYLRVANVLEDRIDFNDLRTMELSSAERQTYRLEAGDILVNEGQSPELVGRPAMFEGEHGEICFQNSLIRFRASRDLVDPRFALLVFRRYLHTGEFERVSRASTNIAHLSKARFAAMPFPVAPLADQTTLATAAEDRLASSQEQRGLIADALRNADDTEAALLKAAMTGRLVAQDPSDESAASLLARVGSPPGRRKKSKAKRLAKTQRTDLTEKEGGGLASSLAALLRKAGGPLPLPELAQAAGVDVSDVDQIEDFYLRLRSELAVGVSPVGSRIENASLDVSDHAH